MSRTSNVLLLSESAIAIMLGPQISNFNSLDHIEHSPNTGTSEIQALGNDWQHVERLDAIQNLYLSKGRVPI